MKLYRFFRPRSTAAVQVEARADHLSADSGALLLREIMERTGIVGWMIQRLVDPSDPNTITYPLADLLRTNLLLLGQGWRDQDDAERLRDDPSLRVANDSRRGTGCLEQDRVLPSQPTMSRLLDGVERGRQSAGGARGCQRTGAAQAVDEQQGPAPQAVDDRRGWPAGAGTRAAARQ